MGDRTAAIIAAVIFLPPVALLIYAAVRNLLASLRNIGQAVDDVRRRSHGTQANSELGAEAKVERSDPGSKSNLGEALMSDTVWISTAPGHASNQRPLTHSFREPEEKMDFARECRKRNEAGESLGPECFPDEIFGAPHAVEKDYRLPDLFFAGSYWAVSKAAADVLRQFDLGGGGLYPVKVLKNDRQTPVEDEWFCLNFGSRKEALLPEESRDLRPGSGGKQWRMPFVPKEGDVAVDRVALDGADIWIDPKARSAFFVSERLGSAIQEAKLKGFFLSKCRVI